VSVYCLALRADHRLSASVRRRRRLLWGGALSLYGLGFTASYLLLAAYFVFFIVSYGTLVTGIVLYSIFLTVFRQRERLKQILAGVAFGFFLGGLGLMWVPEHVLLACDHPFQRLHPHSWFHLTSTIGAYAWGLWAIADWRLVRGERVHRTGSLAAPFVGWESPEN